MVAVEGEVFEQLAALPVRAIGRPGRELFSSSDAVAFRQREPRLRWLVTFRPSIRSVLLQPTGTDDQGRNR